MVDPVMSCLSSISPSLASVECLKVLLGWDPVSNRDVGWLTVLGEIGEGNMTAMAETGLVFREWNMEMGPYTGKGRLEKLEKLLHAVLETMPNRESWRILLAWDSSKNLDVGWFTCPKQSAPQLASIQLRRWNLSLPMELVVSKTSPAVSPPSSRLSLADSKTPLHAMDIPIEQKFSSSSDGCGWLTQNTSTGLSQLAPNQQKERKSKEKVLGYAQVECHLCGKFLSKRGLKNHIYRVHSKPSMSSTNSESSLNSSQKLPTSDQQVNNNDSAMGSSKPEMEEPKTPQSVDKNFPKRETTTKEMAVEGITMRRGNEKCVIMFVFGGRKLKLTTLVQKCMRKAMVEFAKHRGLAIGQLEFRVESTGEMLNPKKCAGDYKGQVVLATRI